MFRDRKKHSQKVFVLIALFFVATQSIFAMLPGTAIAATTTYTWLDHTTIQGTDGSIWIMAGNDVTTYNSTAAPKATCTADNINFPGTEYATRGGGGIAPPTIDGGLLLDSAHRSSANLITFSPSSNATNTNCQPTTHTITINNPIGENLQFYRLDSNTIARIQGYVQTPAATYVRSSASTNEYIESTTTTCKDSITETTLGSLGSFIGRSNSQGDTVDVSWVQTQVLYNKDPAGHVYKNTDAPSGLGCYQTPGVAIPIVTLPPAVLSQQTAVISTGADSGNTKPTCEGNGFSLSWIMCPIVNGLADGAEKLYTTFIQPLLLTPPLSSSTDHSNKIFRAWSSFRTYGDIFLIIALLVTVFGQTIGGGLIDAYTAKKIIPRVVLVAILINLSYYFVGLMMDITNVIGLGLASLMTAPFGLSGDLGLTLNGGANATLGIGAAVGVTLAIVHYGALFGLFWSFILVPTFFAFLSIVVTLLFRKALLIFLVLVSPIAFALYVLPNTEKYFKQWWNLLFKTLLVFPIIAALFGLSKVLAYALNWSSTGPLSSVVSQIMSVVAMVIPLFLIPFAFKIAGGVIGQVANLANMATKNAQKLPFFKSGRERALHNAKVQSLQRRQGAYSRLQKASSNSDNTVLKRRGSAFLAKRMGGYNIEAEMSTERSRTAKEIGEQTAAGADQELRGLTVNKTFANNQGPLIDAENGNGFKRINKDGIIQYKSLGGGWINEADVDSGQARWGKSTFAQQTALAYEMDKAINESDLQNITTNYKSIATGSGGWGNTESQAEGAWIGAAYQNKNQHMSLKHTKWDTGELKSGFVDEIYEKKGSYPLAQMSSFTIENLKKAYATSTDEDEKQKIAAIAETFMHEVSSGGQIGVAGGADSQPIVNPDGTPGRRQASSGGSAHVAERVRELAVMTGVYNAGPAGYYPSEHDTKTPLPPAGPPTATGSVWSSNSKDQK